MKLRIALLLQLWTATVAFTAPRPLARRSSPSIVAVRETPLKEATTAGVDDDTKASQVEEECEVKEELSETQKLMQKVKDAGVAGVISYAVWELGFWAVSVPVVIGGYYEVTGHWPDLSSKEDVAKLGAEAFAFVNFARFAVPLRIGLALSTTPWVQENIVDRFMKKDDDDCREPEE